MHAFKEIRLSAEFGSSGLWNEQSKMLSYEYVHLSVSITQRIKQWHNYFDEKFMPYSKPTEQDWEYHI